MMLASGSHACIPSKSNNVQQRSVSRVLHQQSRVSQKASSLRCAAGRDADAQTSTAARRGLVLAAPLVLPALASLAQPAVAVADEAIAEAPTTSPPSVKGGEVGDLRCDQHASKSEKGPAAGRSCVKNGTPTPATFPLLLRSFESCMMRSWPTSSSTRDMP
eukprot:535799-Pelagomonas_calceolata.AAC.1